MASHLSAEQRQQLGAALREREQLLQDGDDAPQRDADREVDMAVSDLETVELTRIEQALARLQHGGYGECSDCGEDVPFERLALAPHTMRCIACASKRERFQPRGPRL